MRVGRHRSVRSKYIRQALSRSETIKKVRALHQRKQRDAQRRFLVQGRKMVAELLASSWPVDQVYATHAVAAQLAHSGTVIMAEHDLERMGTFDSGNEAIAVVHMPALPALEPPANGDLYLALDGVADPGNMGTILRIADRFGVGPVLLSRGSVDVYNPKCVQASMGSVLRVRTYDVDLPLALEGLQQAGASVYRAEMDGRDVFDVELVRPAVLVLGSEAHGISEAVRAVGGAAITIPQFGGAESLNVAMAASALCMEFARRTRTTHT